MTYIRNSVFYVAFYIWRTDAGRLDSILAGAQHTALKATIPRKGAFATAPQGVRRTPETGGSMPKKQMPH